MQAGSRKLPDAGPELMERKLSDFELEDLPSLPSPRNDLVWSLVHVQLLYAFNMSAIHDTYIRFVSVHMFTCS